MLERLLRNPMAVVVGLVLLALGGVASLADLPVDLFPALDYPLVNVITHYPAGTAEDIEQLVTRPIENAMLGLTHLRRVRSTSAPGFSQVTVEFTENVDALQARQLVASALAAVSLPAGVRPQMENIGTSLALLSTYTLSGGDPLALRAWVEYQLAPQLAALPGVARVPVMGGAVAAWRIDVDPLSLKRHRLSMPAIAAAVRAANVLDTGGTLQRQGRDLLVRTDGRLLTLDALRQVTVGHGGDGRPVRLADVAKVYAGAVPQRYVITRNRLPAVAFSIEKQPGASTLRVSRAVDAVLAATPLPTGATLSKFYDQAEIIGLAYRNMRNNLLFGAALALLAVFAILGRNRASLVIALSLPLTLLATFWVMGRVHLGLNLMTLGALTVAIGMLADDAIVVLENIDRHRTQGKTAWRAALEGTREILSADVAGSLTVLAAFAPLVLVGGLGGRLSHAFGITFSVLLLFSLLVSVTLIPLAAAHWSGRGAGARGRSGDRLVRAFERLNLRLLDLFLRHKRKSLLLVLLSLLGSLALLAFNPARLLPLLDEDSLLLSYQLAPGTSLAESDRVGSDLERRLLALPAIAAVYRRTGSPQSSYYIERPDEGELVLRLDRSQVSDVLATRSRVQWLLDDTPGVVGRVNEPTTEKLDESFSGLPALFGITLYGNSLSALYKAADQVATAAQRVAGVGEVVNNTRIPVDQLRIQPDYAALARFDVSVAQVAEAVRLALQGETLTQTFIDQRPVAVFLRYGAAARSRLEDLPQVQVGNGRGALVPLGQLARIESSSSYPIIEHQRGLRSLTLTVAIDGNPLAVIRRLDRALGALALPADIQWRYSGQYGELLHTGTQLLWALLAAAFLVYGIIAIQLGNLLDPLVVLVKLPLDFSGAALALFITRQHLDLTVALGFLTLIGVATNNGVMLMTFIRRFRQQGMDALAAVHAAVRMRSRPMLLTQLSTLLALIPAALGIGAGPQLLQPLGIMLFGGLTVGTLLTLNLLPVIYLLTESRRKNPLSGSD